MTNSYNRGLFLVQLLAIIIGGLIRASVFYACATSSPWGSEISSHIAVGTGIWSFRDFKEGKYLLQRNIDPYSSNVYRGSPFYLQLFSLTESPWVLFFLLTAADLITMISLKSIAKYFQQKLVQRGDFQLESSHVPFRPSSPYFPIAVGLVFWFNPCSMISNAGLSCVALNHALVSLTIFFYSLNSASLAAFTLAVGILCDVYPVLMLPCLLYVYFGHKQFAKGIIFIFILISTLFFGLQTQRNIVGSWSFLDKFYGSMFLSRIFAPNFGMQWYTMQLIFSRFVSYFTVVFNAVPLACNLPILIRFRKHPVFVMVANVLVGTIFRAFPTVADYTFSICLVIPCVYLFREFKFIYWLGSFMICFAASSVAMFNHWMHKFGNANFYYFQNLLFNICMFWFMLEMLRCVRISEFKRLNDKKPKKE